MTIRSDIKYAGTHLTNVVGCPIELEYIEEKNELKIIVKAGDKEKKLTYKLDPKKSLNGQLNDIKERCEKAIKAKPKKKKPVKKTDDG